jgi:membrane-bound serine protease (ClpP class)
MKILRLFLLLLGLLAVFSGPVRAQNDQPLALVLSADGAVMPAMREYIQRGLETAKQRGAELVILQLNTPGGYVGTMNDIIGDIGASEIPVVVYVAPRRAWAGSAGAVITLAGQASAMAPETIIGAASPVGSGGEDLGETMQRKEKEALKATIRSLTERRSPEAVSLAESMIEDAKAVSANEALQAGLIDFIAQDVNDLLQQLDGFTVQMAGGERTLHTAGAVTEKSDFSLIEQLLLMLTDPNIAFLLLAIGIQAILIEISSPGGWVAGFIGVVCLSLATYGMGVLPVNWFGLVFLMTAFVLFILDIKAPTHGALTAAGVGSFIIGALVLFNSPGTPQFQRVSIPLVVAVGLLLGAMFAVILTIALRAQHGPLLMGSESLAKRTGTVRDWSGLSGQVQLGSELWSAESTQASERIRKGDTVEVVRVEGLRLKVKKK